VGGPWTLFVYAVEGHHAGALSAAKGASDLYQLFASRIVPVIERVARAQLEAGADLVMIFDTAAGELTPDTFRRAVAPDVRRLTSAIPGRFGYYARGLHPAHLGTPLDATLGPIAGLGVDWRWSMRTLLAATDRQGFLQGNFDPALLQLSGATLERAIEEFLRPIADLSVEARRGWICGLGHGVLKDTPETSVRDFVRTVRRRLS
jgi:uroporphyrinogen decarboxylase